MSRYVLGDSVQVMSSFPAGSIDFILTDPPYLVGFTDRSGRSIANDTNPEWVLPASREMFRVLKPNSLMVSFYGWNRVDASVGAWKAAGFRIVGPWCLPSNMPRNPRLSAINTRAPISWRKVGRHCRHNLSLMCRVGNIPATATTRPKNPFPACGR